MVALAIIYLFGRCYQMGHIALTNVNKELKVDDFQVYLRISTLNVIILLLWTCELYFYIFFYLLLHRLLHIR